MIKELFILTDAGALLFYNDYSVIKEENNADLRAGLISAIQNFVATIEDDSIDFIRTKKYSILFKKKS